MKSTNSVSSIQLLRLLGILLLFPFQGFSQNLVGMWTGKIQTTDKILPYEVAITESEGKLTGYSYTTFNVKGEEMVAVKSILVTREKENFIIEDDGLVFNSFDEESPKQLKQTNTLKLTMDGNSMILTGKFKTLKTKEFRSMTGLVRLKKDSIIEQPRLIAKLDEMDLSKSLSFLQPEIPEASIAKVIIEPEKPAVVEKETKPAIVSAPVNTKQTIIKIPAPQPVAVTKPAVPKSEPTAAIVKKPTAVTPKPVAASKPPVAAAKPPVAAARPVAVVPTPQAPVIVKKTEPVRTNSNFTSNLGSRSIENIQTVVFKSDSLVLTLYDNGEVDGDTVSVLLNGQQIISKQRLSTNAINKTIYITPEMGDSLQLIMYAENLGSLPPNTGLLIIKDGRDRYEIRFAGDLTKNAAIILRRKVLDQ